MARIEKTVFISYRRTDVYTALAVYQDLSSKGFDVFFDYTSISSGDFEQIIVSNIRARAHFVLILTPTALDRCSEPSDWLRREIEIAIDEKRNIIPLFFKGFNFGSPSVSEKLTGKLSGLSRYNGLNVHEDYFHAAMNRLSEQFLNVPLETVLHPISTEVRKIVKEEQIAADNALQQKWEEIKEILKPAKEKTNSQGKAQGLNPGSLFPMKGKSFHVRFYIIGIGILLIVIAGIAAINRVLSKNPGGITPTMTIQAATNPISVDPSNTIPVSMETMPTETQTMEAEIYQMQTGSAFATEQGGGVFEEIEPLPSDTPSIDSTMISEKDGMILMYVPASEFQMGTENGEQDERPVHSVSLDTFWIDQTEVTNAMFAEFLNQEGNQPEGGVSWLDTNATDVRIHLEGEIWKADSKYENHPVVEVSWYGAHAYCAWADRRLPTEAEWENAARGMNESTYPWGENLSCSFANYFQPCEGKSTETTAVKSYPRGKSSYGVYDMVGNASEWVNDWYQRDYYDILGDFSLNPKGPENGDLRVLRGGSWNSVSSDVRSLDRQHGTPITATGTIGFRCARDE